MEKISVLVFILYFICYRADQDLTPTSQTPTDTDKDILVKDNLSNIKSITHTTKQKSSACKTTAYADDDVTTQATIVSITESRLDVSKYTEKAHTTIVPYADVTVTTEKTRARIESQAEVTKVKEGDHRTIKLEVDLTESTFDNRIDSRSDKRCSKGTRNFWIKSCGDQSSTRSPYNNRIYISGDRRCTRVRCDNQIDS